MFSFKTCAPIPGQPGGRGLHWCAGGLVEVDGRAVWGRGAVEGGVYVLDDRVDSKWNRLPDGEGRATLAVCRGQLVCVGGRKYGVCSKEVNVLGGGRWTSMTKMLIGCWCSCVVGVGVNVSGLVVMGGLSDEDKLLNDVQVFDGSTWHIGPPLPQPCAAMSAVVHGNLIFVIGGQGMERAVWSANITDLVSH